MGGGKLETVVKVFNIFFEWSKHIRRVKFDLTNFK